VSVLESEGDSFIAIFTDLKTGEQYEYNTTKLQASAVQYFVYLLGGAVLRYTIKKIGSKTVL